MPGPAHARVCSLRVNKLQSSPTWYQLLLFLHPGPGSDFKNTSGFDTHTRSSPNFFYQPPKFLRTSGSAPGCSNFLLARKTATNVFLQDIKIGSPYFVWTSGLNIYKHAMSNQFQASSTAKDFDKVHPYFSPAQKAVSTWREIHLCSSLGAALPSCAS